MVINFMKVIITPRMLGGNLRAIESKSHVHRLLISAALAEVQGNAEVFLPCRVISEDIEATARCVGALGADVRFSDGGLYVRPISAGSPSCDEAILLDCGESGSTYRFLAPVTAALGRTARFKLEGRLPSRPMDELWGLLEAHGIAVDGKGKEIVELRGKLSPGKYVIPGNVSSQFISGLLLALPLLDSDSEIVVTNGIQSAGYIDLTLAALAAFGIKIERMPARFLIPGRQKYTPPPSLSPEGDWSNSAFWLAAAALGGKGIVLSGLNHNSAQGDRAVCEILSSFGASVSVRDDLVAVAPGNLRATTIDAAPIPDLIPALALVAAAAEGISIITNAGRLRLKESDRINSICSTLNSLGGRALFEGDRIIIHGAGISSCAGFSGNRPPEGAGLAGGTVNSFGDHRIVMMAAVASIICRGKVTINFAEAVDKSYPSFFDDFRSLGGFADII